MTITPNGEPVFSEMVTHIEIDDEAAGEFVIVWQPGGRTDRQGIAIDVDEWPLLRQTIDAMIDKCRSVQEQDSIRKSGE